jgi:hypothetical protein
MKNFEPPISLKSAVAFLEKSRDPKVTDAVFDTMVECARGITESSSRIESTVEAIMKNQMQPEVKRAADAKAATFKLFEREAAKIDSARDRTERAILQLDQSTAPVAPRDAVAALLHQEIRQALFAMKSEDRHAAVVAAIKGGDDTFASAALSNHTALTGLGVAERDALADLRRRTMFADEVARAERLRAGLNELDRLAAMFGGWSLGLFAEKDGAIAAAERSAELAKEALAGLVA